MPQDIFYMRFERKRETSAIFFPFWQCSFRVIWHCCCPHGTKRWPQVSWGSSHSQASPAPAKSPSSASSIPGPGVSIAPRQRALASPTYHPERSSLGGGERTIEGSAFPCKLQFGLVPPHFRSIFLFLLFAQLTLSPASDPKVIVVQKSAVLYTRLFAYKRRQ